MAVASASRRPGAQSAADAGTLGLAVGGMIDAVQIAEVDPAAVVRLYADPSTWVSWGHNATRARSDSPLVEGGVVFVRANYGRDYPCRVRRFEPGRSLELEVGHRSCSS